MTDYELSDCISNLMHKGYQVDEMTKEDMSNLLDKYLPESLSVDKFMNDIIGVPSEDFEEILKTWESIRLANSPRKPAITNRAGIGSSKVSNEKIINNNNTDR
jgi:hypothetical protein